MSEYNCDDCGVDCSEAIKSPCREGLIDDYKQLLVENKQLKELLSKAQYWVSNYGYNLDLAIDIEQAVKGE